MPATVLSSGRPPAAPRRCAPAPPRSCLRPAGPPAPPALTAALALPRRPAPRPPRGGSGCGGGGCAPPLRSAPGRGRTPWEGARPRRPRQCRSRGGSGRRRCSWVPTPPAPLPVPLPEPASKDPKSARCSRRCLYSPWKMVAWEARALTLPGEVSESGTTINSHRSDFRIK